MNTYKYLGGWNEACTFFTKDKVYEVESSDRRGNITLIDDSFEEYGSGFAMKKDELYTYFEEVKA